MLDSKFQKLQKKHESPTDGIFARENCRELSIES